MNTDSKRLSMSRSSAVLFSLILLAITVCVWRTELLFRMVDKKLAVLDIGMDGKAKKIPIIPIEWLMPPGKIVFEKLNKDLNVDDLIPDDSEPIKVWAGDEITITSFSDLDVDVTLVPRYQFPKVIRLKNYTVKQNSEGEWIAERKEE